MTRSSIITRSYEWFSGTSSTDKKQLATLPAGTHRTVFDVYAPEFVRYQWMHFTADSAVVTAINFYASALQRNVGKNDELHPLLPKNDVLTGPMWAPLPITFGALPSGVVGSSLTSDVSVRCLALIAVEIVVTTELTDFSLVQAGK